MANATIVNNHIISGYLKGVKRFMESMNGNIELGNGIQINQGDSQINGKKLWNPVFFIVLSIFFTFLPAAILYSLNYGRLGFTKKRNISLIVSFITFAVVILMTIIIKQGAIKSICAASNIAAGVYMNKDQSKLFGNHIQNGGRKASYLVPVSVCLIITAICIGCVAYSGSISDQKIMINGSDLYYTERVDKSEAQKLGNYLREHNFFEKNRKISVKIDKKSSTYRFSMILDNNSIDDREVEQSAKELGKELSENVFNNSKVDIIFCDDIFKPLKIISE